jgi:hypothetical protein
VKNTLSRFFFRPFSDMLSVTFGGRSLSPGENF